MRTTLPVVTHRIPPQSPPEIVLRRSATVQPGVPDLVLARFLRGEELATELSASLARASGCALSEIYETLRRGAIAAAPDLDAIRTIKSMELDDGLHRLVGRLRAPTSSRRDPQALVLSTVGRGVAACICHLFIEQGIPALAVELPAFARCRIGGTGALYDYPSVRYLIVDGAGGTWQQLRKQHDILRQLNVLNSRFKVVFLAHDTAWDARSEEQELDKIAMVNSLCDVVSAANVPNANPLTAREVAVLQHMADGATNGEIAALLGVSLATVKTYLERAQIKLNSRHRAATVATAIRSGWL